MIFSASASTGSRLDQRWLYAGAALVLLSGAAVLFDFDPASSSLYPQCPFRALTGLDCPGCGTLRGLHQLAQGDLIAAFGLNPLMVLSLPFVAFSVLSRAAGELRGRPLSTIFVPSAWIWTLLVVVVSFGVLRNIPAHPFSLLAP
jgi:hypothetical protein